MTADKSIDPRSSGGIDKVDIPGIHAFEFLHQTCVSAQLIFLMVVFCQIEAIKRHDFRVNFLVALIFFKCPGLERQPFLLIVMVKYSRHILSTPGPVGRVVALPENQEQIFVRNAVRVVVDLDSLGMISDTAISWIFLLTAGISDPGPDDTVHTPELGVRSPESAHRKGCGLGIGQNFCIDWRYFIF